MGVRLKKLARAWHQRLSQSRAGESAPSIPPLPPSDEKWHRDAELSEQSWLHPMSRRYQWWSSEEKGRAALASGRFGLGWVRGTLKWRPKSKQTTTTRAGAACEKHGEEYNTRQHHPRARTRRNRTLTVESFDV